MYLVMLFTQLAAGEREGASRSSQAAAGVAFQVEVAVGISATQIHDEMLVHRPRVAQKDALDVLIRERVGRVIPVRGRHIGRQAGAPRPTEGNAPRVRP